MLWTFEWTDALGFALVFGNIMSARRFIVVA